MSTPSRNPILSLEMLSVRRELIILVMEIGGATNDHTSCSAQNQTGILEYANLENHFWFVNASFIDRTVTYLPISWNGTYLTDPFSQDMDDYVPGNQTKVVVKKRANVKN